MKYLSRILEEQFSVLTFRSVKPDLDNNFSSYLLYVLFVTWIVGVGRYWDHPAAHIWQYFGLGSIAYIFTLTTFLYLVVLPINPPRWSWKMVFVFVGFTSLPALLYAVPVERFTPLGTAQAINVGFLGIVALWRVALYVSFLRNGAGIGKFGTFIATLLPLSAIVVSLTFLNLEHAMFEVMAGIRDEERTANDTAYGVVLALGVLAYVMFPITLVCYVIEIYRQRGPNSEP